MLKRTSIFSLDGSRFIIHSIDMDIFEYKCPNCGADLKFNPQAQNLSCEYCGGTFTVDEIKRLYAEKDKEDEAKPEAPNDESADSGEEPKVYYCSSCGAEIMADSERTALFCYYCHNPVILSGKMSGKYRPEKIIGFTIDRENALKKFKSWCFKKFVPRNFKSNQQLEKITGLYVPFWLADCTVSSNIDAIGKTSTHWTSGGYTYTKTKEYGIVRRADFLVQGVPADGSKKIDDELMESIEPFDYTALQDFSSAYLSGFYADKYDMDKEDMLPRISERVSATCREKLRATVGGYDSISVQNESYEITKVDWHYIMLPVWFMSYKYKDKMYEFVLNGQTGKISGSLPIHKPLLNACCAGLFAATTAVVFLVAGFLMGGIF